MNDQEAKAIAARILARKEASGLSYEDLEKLTGMSRSTLQRYLSGHTQKIPLSRLNSLAEALSTTPAYLMGWADSESDELKFNNIFPIETRKFPMLGNVACGKPIFAEENFECYVNANADIQADFCLRACGDSMIGARINDGDIVFVRQQPMVENGEIAVVIIDDEATLKRFYYDQQAEKLVLQAENPAYAPLVYVGRELGTVRVLGKAVAFQSSVR